MWEKFDWTAKLGLTRGKVRSGRRDELTQAFLRLEGPHFYSFSPISSLAVIVIQLEHSSHHAFIDPGISPKCHGKCHSNVTLSKWLNTFKGCVKSFVKET